MGGSVESKVWYKIDLLNRRVYVYGPDDCKGHWSFQELEQLGQTIEGIYAHSTYSHRERAEAYLVARDELLRGLIQ